MERPLQRRLSLAIDNDGSELTLTLEELLSIMLERAMSATRATGAAIALSEDRETVCVAAQGTAPDVGTRLDPQVGFSGMCARKGRILLCDDAEMDPRVDSEKELLCNVSLVRMEPQNNRSGLWLRLVTETPSVHLRR